MPRIQRLSPSLISKIAAGEVIERPFSVVKELVENAMDAGARNIDIAVVEGGRKEIRVVDDGSGMGAKDLRLAIERHATSKISDESDLFRIQTLGFRGEALPSIAAVAWVVIETRADGIEGARLEVEGGKTLRLIPCAWSRGTSVTVRNLFFNTPARLKFLKSRETEFSHIVQWVEAAALSRPEIGFQLSHETNALKRKEFQTPPCRGVRERIGDLLGAEIQESLRPASGSRGGMELTGFVSNHEVNLSSAKGIYLFVNGRIVRDRPLVHAVLSAYENLLMRHRYPWVFLNLAIPPDRLDVNVHPTKSEVRFANGQLVYELVREAVRGGLIGTPKGGFLKASEDLSEPHRQGERFCVGVGPCMDGVPGAKSWNDAGRDPQEAGGKSPFGVLKPIGQIHGTYLLFETPDKLILIDQHAAHERIGFENLKRQWESGRIERQALLIPETLELKPSESEILRQYLKDLEKFGLEVEPFGRSSFLVRATPVLLSGQGISGLLEELVVRLQEEGRLEPLEQRVHEVLETIACHRQLRAGDTLQREEIEALLAQMGETPFATSCPHGRPVLVEIPFAEIERWFKRRQ